MCIKNTLSELRNVKKEVRSGLWIVMVENNFHFRGKMLILTTYISMKIRSKKHVYFIYFWKYSYKTCSKHGCDIFKSIYFQKSLLIT